MNFQTNVIDANIISNNIEQRASEYDELQAQIEANQNRLETNVLNYSERARRHKVIVVRKRNIPMPSVVSDHVNKHRYYTLGEYVCYSASVGLLFFLLQDSLDISLYIVILLILTILFTISLFLPAILMALFKVSSDKPGSDSKVYYLSYFGGFLVLFGIIAFSLTRGTSETEGWMATIYNISLPISELGFAFCAACFRVLRTYFAWSLESTKECEELMQKLSGLVNAREKVFGEMVSDYNKYLSLSENNRPTLRISMQMQELLNQALPKLFKNQSLPVISKPYQTNAVTNGHVANRKLLTEGAYKNGKQ
jgi:predicted Fe-S protein YdhL (DUF1289 family)